MKVDLHLHTSDYSACADSTVDEQLQAAKDKGLDAVFITEHGILYPEKKLVKLRKKYRPLKIFQAIEVTVQDSGWEDFVILGVHDEEINGDKWTYSALYKFVRERNGLIIHAHPYRYSDSIGCNTKVNPPDLVEVLSSNIGKDKYKMRMDYIESIGAKAIINSDSHHTKNTGKYYSTLNDWYDSEEDIIAALKSGKYSISECL